MATMKRTWNNRESEYLKNHYGEMTITDIAFTLNRGSASVHHKAKSLGLVDDNYFWTEREKNYVRTHYQRGNSKDIAVKLGKSRVAVMSKVRELGMSKQSKRWTDEELEYVEEKYSTEPLQKMAEILGRSISSIRSGAQKHTLSTRGKDIKKKFCLDCDEAINKYAKAKRCITCSNKFRSKENHHNWKGGISTLVDMIRRCLFEVWTFPVMQRDSFTCQYCGSGKNKHVHHIRPLKDIIDTVLIESPELVIDNADDKIRIVSMVIALHKLADGVTVCEPCHMSIHYSEKSGELLGTPNVSGEDNQQPSPPKLKVIVGGKVQRLTGEDLATDNPDTSARLPEVHRRDDIVSSAWKHAGSQV